MNICKKCIESLHPDYFKTVDPDSIPWSRATCHHCSAKSEFVIVATKETLDNPQPVPPQPSRQKKIVRKAKKSPTEPETKPAASFQTGSCEKETYQYLLIDWNQGWKTTIADKKKLLKTIEHQAITLGHKDIDVYKLTPLPHKAEIKIEVGE